MRFIIPPLNNEVREGDYDPQVAVPAHRKVEHEEIVRRGQCLGAAPPEPVGDLQVRTVLPQRLQHDRVVGGLTPEWMVLLDDRMKPPPAASVRDALPHFADDRPPRGRSASGPVQFTLPFRQTRPPYFRLKSPRSRPAAGSTGSRQSTPLSSHQSMTRPDVAVAVLDGEEAQGLVALDDPAEPRGDQPEVDLGAEEEARFVGDVVRHRHDGHAVALARHPREL